MTIDIKGMETGPMGSGTTPPVERVRSSAPVSAGTSHGPSATTPDRVNITGAARTLSALQDAVAASPEIDMKRVEQLRQSISLGTYVINPARIADRMLQLEGDLAAAIGRPQG